MPIKQQDDAVNNLVINRFLNYQNAADGGKVLPPRLRGSTRAPLVTCLKVARAQPQTAGILFTITWKSPADDKSQPVGGYRINITAKPAGGPPQMTSIQVDSSPAAIYLPYSINTPIIFNVQTILVSGLPSNPAVSPSTTWITF